MPLNFEWDDRKAVANRKKHGVSFADGATAFSDTLSITVADPDHSDLGEDRFLLVGMTHLGVLVVVAHVERGDNIRIISARRATRGERMTYEEG